MNFSFMNWTHDLTKENSNFATFPQRIAAIDIGSNAIRLLIEELTGSETQQEIFSKRFQLRLGTESFSKGNFSKETQKRFMETFSEIRSFLDSYGVHFYKAVGTSALRDSKASRGLLKRVKEELNVFIEVISGEKEADTILAAVNELDLKRQNCIVMDLGGGSLEIVSSKNRQRQSFVTLPLGAVRSLKYYNKSPEHLQERIAHYLETEAEKLKNFSQSTKNPKLLVGTGGNIRALNKLANRHIPGKIHKKTLTRNQLGIILDKLAALSPEQRTQDLGLATDRSDVILPAAQVFYEFLFYFGFKSIYVPKVSLKHGILAQLRRFGGLPAQAAIEH